MTDRDVRYDTWRTPDGTEPARASHVIAHLSDTHLTSAGVSYNGVIDAAGALNRAVAVLTAAVAGGRHLDAVVVSGDLTDTGDPDAYRTLAGALSSIGQPSIGQPSIGQPGIEKSRNGQPSNPGATFGRAPILIYATGNHDVRPEFHRNLLGRNETGPILQTHDVNGLRVIVLDSSIPGQGQGRLTAAHLAELVAELATPAPAGSLLVLHHAPLPPPSPLLSYFALETSSRVALSEAIRGTDVRLILAGHHHLAQFGMLGPIPVAVAGSTAIRTDPLAAAGHERTWASGAVNLVEVYPDTITVSVIPVDGAAPVFDLDPDQCAAVIDAHPVIPVSEPRAPSADPSSNRS